MIPTQNTRQVVSKTIRILHQGRWLGLPDIDGTEMEDIVLPAEHRRWK